MQRSNSNPNKTPEKVDQPYLHRMVRALMLFDFYEQALVENPGRDFSEIHKVIHKEIGFLKEMSLEDEVGHLVQKNQPLSTEPEKNHEIAPATLNRLKFYTRHWSHLEV